jgi:DNA-binding HxlR family transcriptional regulator
MCKEANSICLCPLTGIIDVISKKWALLIINALGNCGTLRFNKIMEALNGISPKTLSDTLKELQAEGLIRRDSFAEIPPRVEYSLTKDGTELRKSIIPLLEWTANRDNAHNERCAECPPQLRTRYQANLGENKK